MYDELVKRIWECASGECFNCSQYTETTNASVCSKELMKQAADAIEELSKAQAQWIDQERNALLKSIPKWIPVTERLPEKTNHYLVHVKCGCDGELVSAWEQVAWFCEKFYWEHLHGDDVFEETVTHWMPLPEPPEEET